MILNKKYSKNEYLKLKEKIIEHMKNTKEYGEFFPPSISPVCYNETQGNYYMPENKETIISHGWKWEDSIPGTFDKETILLKDIPDDIKNINENFISNIFKCEICEKNYNIIPNELTFYKREDIPIPTKCADCRYIERFSRRLPRKLWHRQCMCKNANHGHLDIGCPSEFETSYAPERPEIVYCEECYNKEVY